MTCHARRSGTLRKHFINFHFAVYVSSQVLVDLKFPNSNLRYLRFIIYIISMLLTCKVCRRLAGNGERSLFRFPFD